MKLARLMILLVCLGFTGASFGCSDDAGDLTQRDPKSVSAIDSGVAGVPVPDGATSATYSPATGLLSEWFVTNLLYPDLLDWYQEQMPAGEDFDEWDWCYGDRVNRVYGQGPKRILSVMVIEDNEVSTEKSLVVRISDDESGPC